jgi:hypothetical protein
MNRFLNNFFIKLCYFFEVISCIRVESANLLMEKVNKLVKLICFNGGIVFLSDSLMRKLSLPFSRS